MTQVAKAIEKKEKELDELMELSELIEDVNGQKIDITTQVLGGLLSSFKESVDDLVAHFANKEKRESEEPKDDGIDKLKTAISEAVAALGEQIVKAAKPVNFSPNINVDLKEVIAVAARIEANNGSILALAEKVSSGDDRIMSQLMEMVKANNEFIRNVLSRKDDSEGLKEIATALNKRPSMWVAKVTEYEQYTGRIKTVEFSSK